MLWKNVIRGLIVATTVGAITACYSWRGKEDVDQARTPSSSDNCSVYDAFSQKGCLEVSHRNMSPGTTIPQKQLTSELAGREIWYKSAPNGRFHTYSFMQRLNSPINWYRVLRTDQRNQRFNIWGTMNDPDCCTPGKDCDAKGAKLNGRSVSLTDTYGFDYCPGDDKLLEYVGRPDKDYLKADPACSNPALAEADKQGDSVRENSCHLAFGTSTGSIGFRKFPNPRFNKARWAKLNGWQGLTEREVEGSIEPPFRVGISCASCHASFEPTNPPLDVNHPQWANISGTVGNQYLRVSDILSSAARLSSIESQLNTPTSRAGATDTSAVPNDMTNNPGTMNAIINIPQRPLFTDKVSRWFHEPCSPSDSSCQTITYADGQKKSWHWATRDMQVFHILKGGEDSVAPDLAVQRVYVNIGMCAEQCWMNHHTDLHTLHSDDRGFSQTPFEIAQCRRDCAPWRANEDRVGDIVQFLLSARPSDLKVALKNQSKISGSIPEEVDANFSDFLEKRYGTGSVEKGRDLFAKNCATCHSSQNQVKEDLTPTVDDFSNVDFHKEVTLPSGEIVRADWMGNDKSTSQAFIKTFQCRSRHSNHLTGHVWEQFASETYRTKPATQFSPTGKPITGGVGYYRNISLLNVWAYAPFLHNNALGPEVCGRPDDPAQEKYRNSYEGEQTGPRQHVCDAKFDPSIEGRLSLFDASVDELLKPDAQRRKKMARATETIHLPVGLDLSSIGQAPQKFFLDFPAGTPLSMIGNFDIKTFIADLTGSLPYLQNKDMKGYNKYWVDRQGDKAGPTIGTIVAKLVGDIDRIQDLPGAKDFMGNLKAAAQGINSKDGNNPFQVIMGYYSNCQDYYENTGHNILVDLNDADKKALKAFLATL